MAFSLGLVLGAVLVATTAFALTGVMKAVLPASFRLLLVGAIAVVCLLREVRILKFRIPQNARLVPESVVAKGPVLGPVQFGFEMGTGVRTYSPSSLPHLMGLSICLILSFPAAVSLGVGFAGGRMLMAFSALISGDGSRWTTMWRAKRHQLAAVLATGAIVSSLFLVWVNGPSIVL